MTLAALIWDWRGTRQAAALEARYREPWRRYHDWSHPLAMPAVAGCPDGALLLDIDLAVLGASEAVFAAYDVGIAVEYGHDPPDAYHAGRAAVLRPFLERDRLYLTDWAYRRWEDRARLNLSRAINVLAD